MYEVNTCVDEMYRWTCILSMLTKFLTTNKNYGKGKDKYIL